MKCVTRNKRALSLTTTQIILLGFLAVILLGSVLLALPISTKTREPVAYVDALFTATSATCVTGLVTLSTVSTWSVFGQVVILFLIQIGGLGVITVMSAILLAFHKKMGIKDNLLIQDAFNLNTLSGLAKFVKRVLCFTLIAEALGAVAYMTVFVPDFGAKGIWISLFNAVSAFCNAGIDIVAESSLCAYVHNPIINFVTSALIVGGGLGYIVWWDLARVLRKLPKMGIKCLKTLSLHSKVVLTATLVLIVGGGLAIFALEYDNPNTIGSFTFFQKLQAAFFQSVTTRTAGFATLPQEHLTQGSAIVCLLLMFIGGSPVGTAGGVKTVTIVVLFATGIAALRNKNETTLFARNVSRQAVRKSIAVVMTSFITVFVSTLLLSIVTQAPALDLAYEAVSATATVGLSRNLTTALNVWGKWIITITMYLGRVGPISMAIAFGVKRGVTNAVKNPTEEMSIG